MQNVIQCCLHSPITGGKHSSPNKYCFQHKYLNMDCKKLTGPIATNALSPPQRKRSKDEATCSTAVNKQSLTITINLKEMTCFPQKTFFLTAYSLLVTIMMSQYLLDVNYLLMLKKLQTNNRCACFI